MTLIKKDREAGKTAPGAFHEYVPVAGCYIRMSKRTAQSLHPPESDTGIRINCKFLFFLSFFYSFFLFVYSFIIEQWLILSISALYVFLFVYF